MGKLLKLRLMCKSPVAPHEKSIRSRLRKLSFQSTDHYDNFSYLLTYLILTYFEYVLSFFAFRTIGDLLCHSFKDRKDSMRNLIFVANSKMFWNSKFSRKIFNFLKTVMYLCLWWNTKWLLMTSEFSTYFYSSCLLRIKEN